MSIKSISLLCIIIVLTLLRDLAGFTDLSVIKYSLLRGVALVSFIAFHSVYIQLLGLIGENGLIPITSTLHKLKNFTQQSVTWNQPIKYCMKHLLLLVQQKFHVNKNMNVYLSTVCKIDMTIALIAIVYPHTLLFVYMYFSYYSYKRVMDRFLNYQWDALLLETLLLTIILSLSFDSVTVTIGVWQFKILLFRLMFGSGVVKYFGRDESWHTSYTAMCYHFLTQPLPSTLGMYIHTHASVWMLKGMTVGTLVVELLLPILSIINIDNINIVVALSYIMLQLSIGMSGFYGFFGSLSSVLSISLLTESFLVSLLSGISFSIISKESLLALAGSSTGPQSLFSLLSTAFSAIVIYPLFAVVTVVQLTAIHNLLQYIPFFSAKKKLKDENVEASPTSSDDSDVSTVSIWSITAIGDVAEKLHNFTLMTLFLGCHYGLFASMTKVRNEMTILLSEDKVTWYPIDFAYKPGSEYLQPKAIVPFYHMPRLDWSMWFLPFTSSKAAYPRWFWVLLLSILEGNTDVLNIMNLSNKWKAASSTSEGDEPQRINYEDKPMKYIKIQLVKYEYMMPNDEEYLQLPKKYWKVQPVRDIQQPSTIEDLYELLDAHDKIMYGSDPSLKPKAESASDIIARTLRAMAQKKANKEKKTT